MPQLPHNCLMNKNTERTTMTAVKKYLLLALLWAAPSLCFGQAQISNVWFEQSDDVVLIKYHLDLKNAKEVKNVKAFISLDGGLSYKQLTKVSGDVGTVKKSGEKQIIFDIFKEFGHEDISGYIRFKVEGETVASASPLIFLEYLYSPTAPFGFSVGYAKQWGAYGNYKISTSLEGDSTFGNTSSSYHRVALTAGVMMRVLSFNNAKGGLYLYSGAGYGEYGKLYDDWTFYYSPELLTGIEAEGGLVLEISGFVCSIGFSTIFSNNSQRFADIHVGVGFNLGRLF